MGVIVGKEERQRIELCLMNMESVDRNARSKHSLVRTGAIGRGVRERLLHIAVY